jgi:hypothetical protein
MKSYLRWSKCSGSTKAKIMKIVSLGDRAVRRSLNASQRRGLRTVLNGKEAVGE